VKRVLPILLALLAAPAPAQTDFEEEFEGAYHCRLRHTFDGILDISQSLSVRGEVRQTDASWVQPTGLYNRKRPEDRDVADPSYMTISVDSRRSPAANDPGWFDMAGAKVQITVVTRGKMRRATTIVFRRPSRTGERYEDGLSVAGRSSRAVPWTSAALPYRVFRAFAEGEPLLSWTLLRWVGGDAEWEHVEEGKFDLRKVDAFARATEAARPALDALRADYRNRCQLLLPAEPAIEDRSDPLG
jgi:hypothetical protein